MNDLFERLDFGFFAPVWLGVGTLAVLAILLLTLGASRRRRQALELFTASHLARELTASVSRPRRRVREALLLLAVALLFIALARPHLFSGWREESRTGLDVLLAVDCSRSMLTEDVHPNRLERAKLAIADFAEHLPDNRLGLIAFAGDAFLQCPLTLDHDAFEGAVRELDTDTIPRPGTDVAAAIDQAVLALHSQPANRKFLILITDGEDLEARGIESAKKAAQAGLKIFTIGVGSPGGGLIPQRDDSGAIAYLHDASGQIVQSRLDEATLREIAASTGGAYLPLGQNGEGLDQIYQRYIATLPKQSLEERREKVRYDRFAWPLGLAILLLIGEFLVSERKPGSGLPPEPPPIRRGARVPPRTREVALRMAVAALLLGAPGLHAAPTDAGERAYKAGRYEDALQDYRQAAVAHPGRQDIQYNVGDAAYKAGAFDDAEKAYRNSLETPDLGLQEKTYYNLGNAQFKHGEAMQQVDSKKTIDMWEHALNSYTSALKLKEAADTRHNYELVKRRLEQLKQQQQQQQQKQNGGGKSDQKNQGKPQDPNGKDNPQNQDGQPDQNPGNGQDQKQGQQPPPEPEKDGKSGQEKKPSQDMGGSQPKDAPKQAQSQARAQDQVDPGVRSRQEAEALLDSLKDDERHVGAKALTGNSESPPPPNSGKDW